jgi:hypothetical protein
MDDRAAPARRVRADCRIGRSLSQQAGTVNGNDPSLTDFHLGIR